MVTAPWARATRADLRDRVERARGRLRVDDRDDRDLGMRGQVGLDGLGRDRLVVGHLDLVEVGADGGQPVAEALAEDARDEVQAGRRRAARGERAAASRPRMASPCMRMISWLVVP